MMYTPPPTHHVAERSAAPEAVVPDAHHTLRNADVSDAGAAVEGLVADLCEALREVEVDDAAATVERVGPDRLKACGVKQNE